MGLSELEIARLKGEGIGRATSISLASLISAHRALRDIGDDVVTWDLADEPKRPPKFYQTQFGSPDNLLACQEINQSVIDSEQERGITINHRPLFVDYPPSIKKYLTLEAGILTALGGSVEFESVIDYVDSVFSSQAKMLRELQAPVKTRHHTKAGLVKVNKTRKFKRK